jgi:hypothetical protein
MLEREVAAGVYEAGIVLFRRNERLFVRVGVRGCDG